MARQGKSSGPNVEAAIAAIEAGRRQPIYVFHGANTQRVEEAVEKLKRLVVGDDDAFAALQIFRGEEARGAEIVSAARTVPMLVEEQMVLVRRADALSAEDQAALLPYLESPTPSTCLVLVATKLDRRLKLWATASKKKLCFEAPAAQERELSGVIAARARARGLTLHPAVAHMIGEATGTDPTTIEDALDRLRLYVGDAGEVTAADVEAVVSSSRVHSIFELTDAIGRRDLARALKVHANMIANREAPLRILATLATHMRRLLEAAELGPDIGANPSRLASELSLPPFLARKVVEQASHFSRGELRAAQRRLAMTDLELKSSKRPDMLIMEEMLMALCLGRPRVDRAARRRAALRRG